ncbi:hypothetical protein PQG02_20190 [Nostoc sp. UHCC 0926]|uniref:hypothetical protein n=1 Tax=Nostoc sp. TaxID=1180 RepID=UPI0027A1408D|nr:hypothetical protein PQG02_20190 [Nostoc sp. UHCC 0926]
MTHLNQDGSSTKSFSSLSPNGEFDYKEEKKVRLEVNQVLQIAQQLQNEIKENQQAVETLLSSY